MNTLHYHAVGIVSTCCDLSQVREALAVLDVPYHPVDFRSEMAAFTELYLRGMQG